MTRSATPQRDAQRQSGLRQQPLVLFGLVLLFCGAMASRLAWLQLLEGPRYRQLADENRIRLVPRSPTRGRLLDRKGRVWPLASSPIRSMWNHDWWTMKLGLSCAFDYPVF